MAGSVSALSINLDSSKAVSGESERAERVLEEAGRMAEGVRPDVVFTQDKFSGRNLDRLREKLDSNVPGSQFGLEKLVIGGADHVSVFVNKNKFDVDSVEKEKRGALDLLRRSNLEFFNEDRAVFIVATEKQNGYKLLLSSFHAKKNKCTDIKREQLIIEYLSLVDEIFKMVKAQGILIGTDINHKMKKFEQRNKKMIFCVDVFHYNYPDGFGRKIEELPVLDYFLKSPNLNPQTAEPTVFNIDLKILDHHPIHSIFTFNPQKTSNTLTSTVITTTKNLTSATIYPHLEPALLSSLSTFIPGFKKETLAPTTTPFNSVRGLASLTSTTIPFDSASGLASLNASCVPPKFPKANLGSDTLSSGIITAGLTSIQSAVAPDLMQMINANPEMNGTDLAHSYSKPVSNKGDVNEAIKPDIQSGASILPENKFECSTCSRIFSSQHGLSVHIGMMHPCSTSYSTHKCLLCSKTFDSQHGLSVHNGKMHQEVEFKCSPCSKTFKNKKGLSVHNGKMHKT